MHVTRIALATFLLLGSVSAAQGPDTYFAPIVDRTGDNTVGATALQTSIWLSDPGTDAGLSLLFGTGGGSSASFGLDGLAPVAVSGFPPQADAVATAAGVLVGGSYRTLLAVSSNGSILFGTIESGAFRSAGVPATPIPSGTLVALSAVPDGGAALLVSDGTLLTRWDLDLSTGAVNASRGFSVSATPTSGGTFDQPNTLFFDGLRNLGFVGGRILGDVYQFDPNLDAGAPTVFDPGQVSQGRLAAPVTGITLYPATGAGYLLVASAKGITFYNRNLANPLSSAFRVIPIDSEGPITTPAGVALTNLPAGPLLPLGAIAVGDLTHRNLALLSWGALSVQIDAGLPVDTTDPRGTPGDGGAPDGGGSDAGGGGGGGPSGPPGGAPGPGIPVDHPSSCASAAGPPTLVALVAGLGALASRRRRQRR